MGIRPHALEYLDSEDHRPAAPRAMSVPPWLDQTASWSWRLLLVASVIIGGLWLLSLVRVAVVPALIAVIFASTVRPLVTTLCRRGFPALVATTLPFLALLALVGGGLYVVAIVAIAEINASEVEFQTVQTEIETWLIDGPLGLTRAELDDIETEAVSALSSGVRSFGVNHSRGMLSIATGTLLAVMLAFFFTKDGPDLWDRTVSKLNPARRSAVREAGHAAARTMASYVRSVALTGLFDALFIGLGLVLLGVPLVVPLMYLTFLAAFLPVVGAVVAGMAAATVALITVGPLTALYVVALTVAVQQIEGNVVMPMIAGRNMDVHPALILIALTAGGALAGLVGALLAVPTLVATITAISTFKAETAAAGLAAPPDQVHW